MFRVRFVPQLTFVKACDCAANTCVISGCSLNCDFWYAAESVPWLLPMVRREPLPIERIFTSVFKRKMTPDERRILLRTPGKAPRLSRPKS